MSSDHPDINLATLAQAMHDVCDRPQDYTEEEIAAVMDATITGLAGLPPQRRALVEMVLLRRRSEAPAESAA